MNNRFRLKEQGPDELALVIAYYHNDEIVGTDYDINLIGNRERLGEYICELLEAFMLPVLPNNDKNKWVAPVDWKGTTNVEETEEGQKSV